MIRLYLDTEFTQLNLSRQLISLALVSSSGREFYVEITDTWNFSDCSEFVKTVVLPQLNPAKHGQTFSEARAALRCFLASEGEAEVIGDALKWDWPLLLELLGPEGLPTNIVGCREIDGSGIDAEKLSGEAPEAPHHALLDARILAKLCEPK